MCRMHNRRMPFPATTPQPVLDGHVGYVAGRYRNGAYSDIWTDVRRCAERTFTAYAPACSCGWRGRPQPATDVGHLTCRRIWSRKHLAHAVAELAGDTGAPLADDQLEPDVNSPRPATAQRRLASS